MRFFVPLKHIISILIKINFVSLRWYGKKKNKKGETFYKSRRYLVYSVDPVICTNVDAVGQLFAGAAGGCVDPVVVLRRHRRRHQ